MRNIPKQKPEILLRFGETIRNIRKEKGLSQDALADDSGLHRTHIGMIERGEKNVNLMTIGKLAKALRIEIKDIFNGIDISLF